MKPHLSLSLLALSLNDTRSFDIQLIWNRYHYVAEIYDDMMIMLNRY